MCAGIFNSIWTPAVVGVGQWHECPAKQQATGMEVLINASMRIGQQISAGTRWELGAALLTVATGRGSEGLPCVSAGPQITPHTAHIVPGCAMCSDRRG
jgi:hypothetical protein